MLRRRGFVIPPYGSNEYLNGATEGYYRVFLRNLDISRTARIEKRERTGRFRVGDIRNLSALILFSRRNESLITLHGGFDSFSARDIVNLKNGRLDVWHTYPLHAGSLHRPLSNGVIDDPKITCGPDQKA